jgi:hypothetical protein
MNWLYYLAEANLYLGVFYAAYCVFLRNETYYQLNRAYLLCSCVVAFVLPVLQIGLLKPAEVAVATSVDYVLPIETTQVPIVYNNIAPVVAAPALSTDDYLWFIYLTGVVVLFIVLLVKLYSLYRLINKATYSKKAGYKLIELPKSDIAFSFFNYLFIGTNAHGAHTIMKHELVHIRQKHSVDIIFLELLKIINWFNPIIYLIQTSLKTVHEYIADEQTSAHETDPISYATFLLNNAYGTGGPAVTHSFFNYNLLKKRIAMLNQKRSGNLARLRYLVALPVLAASLCASTLAFSKTYGWVDIAPAKAITTERAASIATKAAFTPLIIHLAKTIPYHPSKGDKHGLVEVSFILGDDHKITDAKAINQADSKLIALAENGFKAFDKTIEAAPGKYTFDVYFDDKEYWFIHHKTEKTADLAGEVSLSELRYTNKNGGIVSNASVNNAFVELGDKTNLHLPVIVVNNKPYQFSSNDIAALKAGADLLVSGTPTSYAKDNTFAIKTWGDNAKNGVMVLDGENAGVKIKSPYAGIEAETKTGSLRKFTPPSLAEAGYKDLGVHLLLSLRKKTFTEFRTSQLAIVSFDIKSDHSISAIKILKSAGQKLDDVALAAFKSFNGKVADDAGEGKFVVNFYRKNNTAENTAIINDAAYKGRLVLDMENSFRSSFLDKNIPAPVFKDKKTGRVTAFLPYGNLLTIIDGNAYKAVLPEKIMADAIKHIPANNRDAIEKWGANAKNGVVIFTGNIALQPNEQTSASIGLPVKPQTPNIQKLPPPSVYKKGFGRLMGHLHQKVTYTEELKNEKNSYVGVSFIVGADKRISNIQIFKPAGNGFDAVAKAAFESFDGVVTAPAGKHTFMVNYFSEKGPVDKAILSNTTYDVKLVVVRPKPGEVKVKFPAPVVKADKKVSATAIVDSLPREVQKKFIKFLFDNIKYPPQDRAKTIDGPMVAVFAIDEANELKYAKVLRSPSDYMSKEVIRVLKMNSYLSLLEPGKQYIIPIQFLLKNEDDSPLLTKNPISSIKMSYTKPGVIIPEHQKSTQIDLIVILGYQKKV